VVEFGRFGCKTMCTYVVREKHGRWCVCESERVRERREREGRFGGSFDNLRRGRALGRSSAACREVARGPEWADEPVGYAMLVLVAKRLVGQIRVSQSVNNIQ
jgi:hypothetical protein